MLSMHFGVEWTRCKQPVSLLVLKKTETVLDQVNTTILCALIGRALASVFFRSTSSRFEGHFGHRTRISLRVWSARNHGDIVRDRVYNQIFTSFAVAIGKRHLELARIAVSMHAIRGRDDALNMSSVFNK
jgi:hypothetical protein